MLISFSGLDGAGKGTQIDKLEVLLMGHGRQTIRLWARGGYTPGFEWLKRILRLLSGRRWLPAGKSSARKKQLTRPGIARLWLGLAMLDLLWFWGVYLRWHCLRGRVVICDRYIDDTRLDFRQNFPSIAFEQGFLWRLLTRSSPKPDVALLLWIPVAESMRRSRLKGEPFPDDEATLSWRLGCYLDETLFPIDRFVKLDGTQPVEGLAAVIQAKVEARLGEKGRRGAA